MVLDSEESPPQPPGAGYRDRPPKGRVSMPCNNLPAGNQNGANRPHIGVHRHVTSPTGPDTTRLPWRPVGTAIASLGAPIGMGILRPTLGELIAVIEVVVALTIVVAALFGSQTVSERAFRLLRWFGNRPEPPAPTLNREPR
jgi:hypothetical protein